MIVCCQYCGRDTENKSGICGRCVPGRSNQYKEKRYASKELSPDELRANMYAELHRRSNSTGWAYSDYDDE